MALKFSRKKINFITSRNKIKSIMAENRKLRAKLKKETSLNKVPRN